jgi:hypothetical protein
MTARDRRRGRPVHKRVILGVEVALVRQAFRGRKGGLNWGWVAWRTDSCRQLVDYAARREDAVDSIRKAFEHFGTDFRSDPGFCGGDG